MSGLLLPLLAAALCGVALAAELSGSQLLETEAFSGKDSDGLPAVYAVAAVLDGEPLALLPGVPAYADCATACRLNGSCTVFLFCGSQVRDRPPAAAAAAAEHRRRLAGTSTPTPALAAAAGWLRHAGQQHHAHPGVPAADGHQLHACAQRGGPRRGRGRRPAAGVGCAAEELRPARLAASRPHRLDRWVCLHRMVPACLSAINTRMMVACQRRNLCHSFAHITVAGFPVRSKAPPTMPGLVATQAQGVFGGDFSCPDSVVEGACAFRDVLAAAFRCSSLLIGTCQSVVVYVNGTSGCQGASLAVLKVVALWAHPDKDAALHAAARRPVDQPLPGVRPSRRRRSACNCTTALPSLAPARPPSRCQTTRTGPLLSTFLTK